MNKAKFLCAIVAALITGCLFTNRSEAQSTVTVQLSQNDYNLVQAQTATGGALMMLTQGNIYRIDPTGPFPGTPPPPPLCPEGRTLALAAQMQAEANRCCCTVLYCVVGSNCGYYLMYAEPLNGLCTPSISNPPNGPFQVGLYQ